MRNISKRNGLVVPFHDRNDCSVWKPCCCEDRSDPPGPEPECEDNCQEFVETMDGDHIHNGVDNDPTINFDIMVLGAPSPSSLAVVGEGSTSVQAQYPFNQFNKYPTFTFTPPSPAADGDKLGTVTLSTATKHNIGFTVDPFEFGDGASAITFSFNVNPTQVQSFVQDNGDGTYTMDTSQAAYSELPTFVFECVEEVEIAFFAEGDSTSEVTVFVVPYDAVECGT